MNQAINGLAAILVCTVMVLSASACAKLQVTKIKPGEEDGGLAYCLLVPKLQLTTKEAIVYDKEDLTQSPYAKAARPVTNVTASLVQVPSLNHYYSAKIKSGWFTSDSYKVDYDANGCLSAYNFTTNDQTGTALSTLASIALAAAVVAAPAALFTGPEPAEGVAPKPSITYPEPPLTTYLIHRASKKLLVQADKRLEELTGKFPTLTKAEQEELAALLEKATKLRDLLNPVPSRVSKIEYQDLYFVPEGRSADEYVISLVTAMAQRVALPSDFLIGVARRLK